LNRHVGLVRPDLPKAHKSLSGEERASTGIRAGHPKRSRRRSTAASKQQDQRSCAGPRGERSKQSTTTEHGGSREGLSCPRDQLLPRDVQLLPSQGHSLLGRVLD
jgi:hypothetical protein